MSGQGFWHTPRLYAQILSLEFRQMAAYRLGFWFRTVLLVAAEVVVAYYLWRAVYTQTGQETIGGLSFDAMLLYFFLVPVVDALVRHAPQGFLATDIYQGTLTRYLVYPVALFPYKYVSSLPAPLIAAVQAGLILLGYGLWRGFPADAPASLATFGAGLGLAVAGGILNFALCAVIEMVAFWADNVWGLSVMLMFCVRLLGGGFVPLSLFPDWAQRAVAWTPFPYLLSTPLRAMMGRVTWEEAQHGLLVTGLWTLAAVGIGVGVWRRGMRQYSGVGI